MKKLLIYTNKEYTSVHIIEEDKIFKTLMELLSHDIYPYQIDVITYSLDKVLRDNDISFELISLDEKVLPEGIKLTTQKTEHYND